MGSSAPAPPQPPNPFFTAQAQTGENVATAIANAELSHVNQTDATGGHINYSQTGYNPISENGITYNIPQYQQSTTLSPFEQRLFNTNLGTQQNLADIGNTQSAAIGKLLNTPINLPGIDALPTADLTSANINKFINTNWEQPFNNLTGRQQEQLNQNLADQGIHLNDPAYKNAQYDFGQQIQGQQDTYANAMYGTAAQNILAQTNQQDQNILNRANFNNQTALTNRNEGLNELSALMSGSQVAGQNFSQVPQQNIPTTDFAGIMQNNYQDQLAAYNQQVQNQSATNGGLFGLGGAVLGGLARFSDRFLKTAIKRIGELDNGLNVYHFRYIWAPDEEHIGLMADEVKRIHPGAVVKGPGGFDMVDYEMAVR